MQKRLVIALGGNALGNTPEEQLELVKHTAETIVDLMESGYQVMVGHGNGPQVGMIHQAMDLASNVDEKIPYMPFPECGAMSQGYIGYQLQQAIRGELKKRKREQEVATVITQVVVDPGDEAFAHPQKPIGRFYTKEQAEQLHRERQFAFMEDAGRGYRRVVPSPQPMEIVELNVVQQLVNSDVVVITVGGGGIPVVKTPEGLQGVAAVIDKDKSCAKLAEDLHADILVILTAVEQVCLRYNQPDETKLSSMTVEEAKMYIANGEFAPGSMLPKIEACLQFLKGNPQGKAVITSLERAKDALTGKTGTEITI